MPILILRDIPKERVQIDVLMFDVEGGFRGFQSIPAGYHRVAVHSGGKSWAAEVVVEDVTILSFDDGFSPAPDADMEALARSGAMNSKLIDPTLRHSAVLVAWMTATSRLRGPWRQVPIPSTEGASRIRAFLDGGEDAARVGVQAAFAALVDGEDGALERLQKIIEAHFNGGRAISEHAAYFVGFAEVLAAFRTVAPSLDVLSFNNAQYFLEDVAELGDEGRAAIERLRA
jgi:hypothetical protein